MAKYKIAVNAKWCKSCGICAAFCPRQVFDTDDEGRLRVSGAENCVGCRMCEYRCPDMAITVIQEEQNERE